MTRMTESGEDLLDMRDITDRFEELEDQEERDEGDEEEYEALANLIRSLKGYGGDHQWRGDWYPGALIEDSYFQKYAEELADELYGREIGGAKWPFSCIDWEQAARELQTDYSTVEYGSFTYWYR